MSCQTDLVTVYFKASRILIYARSFCLHFGVCPTIRSLTSPQASQNKCLLLLGRWVLEQLEKIGFAHHSSPFTEVNIFSKIPHHHSLESAAENSGVGDLFTKELIDGASRCNYNQAGNVNSFTDLISLAGAGVAGHVFGLANGTQVGRLGWAGQLQLLVSWKNIWKTRWFSQGMTRMPSFSSSATNCQDISKGLVKVANRLRLNDRVTEIYDAESGAWAPKTFRRSGMRIYLNIVFGKVNFFQTFGRNLQVWDPHIKVHQHVRETNHFQGIFGFHKLSSPDLKFKTLCFQRNT